MSAKFTIRGFIARMTAKCLAAAVLSVPLTAPAVGMAQEAETTRLAPKQVNDIGLRSAVWVLNGTVAHHQSQGSGWILDKEKGLIVTNEHVIRGSDVVDIFFPVFEDGRPNRDVTHYLRNVKPTRAVVIDREFNRDLAILKVDAIPATSRGLKVADKGIEEGDEVRAVGGLPKGNEALWGTVRGEVRLVAKRPNANGWVGRMMVTDMPTNPGNSGGAILNDRGEVVGVVESGYKGDFALSVTAHVDLSELKEYLEVAAPLADAKSSKDLAIRGKRRLDAGRTDFAVTDLTAAIKADKTNVDALIARGRAFLAKNDPATALSDLDAAIKLDDAVVDAPLLRGKANARLGKIDAALADMTEVIRIDPATARGYNERGIIQLDFAKNPSAAVEDFTRAIKAEPHDSVLWSNRAIAHESLKNYKEAAADLTEAVARRSNDAQLRNRLGLMQLWSLHNPAAAQATFQESVKIDPTNSVYTANLADAFLEAGRFDRALELFNDAFNMDRSRPLLNTNYTAFRRGLARSGLKDWSGAIGDFSKAIELNPKFARAFWERSQAHEQLGNASAAKNDREQAVKLDPSLDSAPKPKSDLKTTTRTNADGDFIRGTWVFSGTVNGIQTYEATTFKADGLLETRVVVTPAGGKPTEVLDQGTFQLNGDKLTMSFKKLGTMERKVERKGDSLSIGMTNGTGALLYTRK